MKEDGKKIGYKEDQTRSVQWVKKKSKARWFVS